MNVRLFILAKKRRYQWDSNPCCEGQGLVVMGKAGNRTRNTHFREGHDTISLLSHIPDRRRSIYTATFLPFHYSPIYLIDEGYLYATLKKRSKGFEPLASRSGIDYSAAELTPYIRTRVLRSYLLDMGVLFIPTICSIYYGMRNQT